MLLSVGAWTLQISGRFKVIYFNKGSLYRAMHNFLMCCWYLAASQTMYMCSWLTPIEPSYFSATWSMTAITIPNTKFAARQKLQMYHLVSGEVKQIRSSQFMYDEASTSKKCWNWRCELRDFLTCQLGVTNSRQNSHPPAWHYLTDTIWLNYVWHN